MTTPNPQARFPQAPGTRPRNPNSSNSGSTRRSSPPQSRKPLRSIGPAASTARDYGPTRLGEKAGTLGTLEAEFVGCILLIFLTVFTDASSSYADKLLAIMKRGTLASVLFFILALFSTAGEGAAKFAKAFGLLVMVGIFLSTGGQDTISVLDTFFKADWTGNNASDSSANAPAGQQQPTAVGPTLAQIEQTIGSDAAKAAVATTKVAGEGAINAGKGAAAVGYAAGSSAGEKLTNAFNGFFKRLF